MASAAYGIGFHFHTNVEEAVRESVSQNKVLVVYISPSEGHDEWLQSWFLPSAVTPELADKSVWLRLVKDSQGFEFLKQLFPHIQAPSLYLIKDQSIQVIIHGENGAGEFSHWNRLVDYLTTVTCMVPGTVRNDSTRANAVEVPPSSNVGPTPTDIGSTAKVETQKMKKTFKEEVNDLAKKKHHEEMLRQRKLAKDERERILKLVQHDKEERKARELMEKAKFQAEANGEQEIIEVVSEELSDNCKNQNLLNSEKCTLLIKLTNSESITNIFESSDTLVEVRKWVDSKRTDGSCSYLFHTNIPRKTFSLSEESATLKDLKLTPRSVLILDVVDQQNDGVSNRGILGSLLGRVSFWRNYSAEKETVTPLPTTSVNDDDAENGLSSSQVSETEQTKAFPYLTQVSKENSQIDLNAHASSQHLDDVLAPKKKDDDRPTYNGNSTNLESKKDE